ncbi:MAG: hypothetical protein MUF54_21365 [Polyangiaceae bacterium]|nr:hypothetical protein [Polyangiaceae bacterium]
MRHSLALLAAGAVQLGYHRSHPEGPAPPCASAVAVVPLEPIADQPAARHGAPSQSAPMVKDARRPRIGALDHDVYILERPSARRAEIGAIGLGGSVPLRQSEPVSRAGCARGWFAVEPQGFVCLDRRATLEVETHPLMVAAQLLRGKFDQPTPYSWGESRGTAPLYKRVPTQQEQKRTEPQLDKHLAALEKFRALRRAGADEQEVPTPPALQGVDIFPSTANPPAFLAHGALSPWANVHLPGDSRAGHKVVPRRSTIAWADEFFAEGRSWLVTPDLPRRSCPSPSFAQSRAPSIDSSTLTA